MARPSKKGLEYFPFDVDFFEDDKLAYVRARFGAKGEIVALKLLCRIYRDDGYFMAWDDDAALLFASRVGGEIQHSLVKDVVYELLKRGFFDRSIFETFGVLTSHGIQARYFRACKDARRRDIKIDPRFDLISSDDGYEWVSSKEVPPKEPKKETFKEFIESGVIDTTMLPPHLPPVAIKKRRTEDLINPWKEYSNEAFAFASRLYDEYRWDPKITVRTIDEAKRTIGEGWEKWIDTVLSNYINWVQTNNGTMSGTGFRGWLQGDIGKYGSTKKTQDRFDKSPLSRLAQAQKNLEERARRMGDE
jgi:hypothetical protein